MPEITQGLIDLALHPALGSLRPHLDGRGPYTGNQTLTTWSFTPGPTFSDHWVSDSFGALVSVASAIPVPYGYDIGWAGPIGESEDVFHNELAQLVVQHQFLGGGWVTTQKLSCHKVQELIMWEVALPGRIGIRTAPGLSIDLYYLLVN